MSDTPPVFEPNAYEVALDAGGEFCSILFSSDDGAAIRVVLPRDQIYPLSSLLAGKGEPGQGAPISLHALRPGRMIAIDGWQVKGSGDEIHLTLHARLPEEGRVVTIPCSLTRAEAKEVIAELVKAL